MTPKPGLFIYHAIFYTVSFTYHLDTHTLFHIRTLDKLYVKILTQKFPNISTFLKIAGNLGVLVLPNTLNYF